jgi:hypothetical protein
MWIRSRAVAAVTTGIAVLLSVASPAAETSAGTSAETADASDGDGRGGLQEVTVSARRREENVQDVPIPITTLSGNSLEDAGQYRLEDLNQRLPSLNAQFANPRQTSIALRGLGNNPANDGLESSGRLIDTAGLGAARCRQVSEQIGIELVAEAQERRDIVVADFEIARVIRRQGESDPGGADRRVALDLAGFLLLGVAQRLRRRKSRPAVLRGGIRRCARAGFEPARSV